MITLVVPLVSHVDLRKNVNVRIVHQRNHPIFAQDEGILKKKCAEMGIDPESLHVDWNSMKQGEEK